ncbi:MAG: hypothetical protein Rhirs2KO_37220 [Rhizobiaceae bacterium]
MQRWLAIAIGGAAALSAVAGGLQATGNAIGPRAPDLASDLSGSSPVATELLTRMALRISDGASDLEAIDLSAAQEPARETLSRSLLSPLALAVVAWDAPAERRAAMIQAGERISRRDSLLQGMLTQYYVENDENLRAIAAMNALLRVHPATTESIVSTMVPLLEDDELLPAFGALMADGAPWSNNLLLAASEEPRLMENLSRLRLSLPNTAAIPPSTDRTLISRYAKTEGFSKAKTLYTRLRQDASLQDMVGAIDWRTEFAPFDWAFADDFNAYARPGDGGGLAIRIRPGNGGVLATRVVYPAARVDRMIVEHDFEPTQQLAVSVACADAAEAFATGTFERSPITLDLGRHGTECEAVRIVIAGRAWSTGNAIEGTISQITFD